MKDAAAADTPPPSPAPGDIVATGPTGQPPALSRAQQRAQARTAELVKCTAEVQAILDQYDAAFDVIEVTTFANGQRHTTHQVKTVARA